MHFDSTDWTFFAVAGALLVGYLAWSFGELWGRWAVIESHAPGWAGTEPVEGEAYVARRCWTGWGAYRYKERYRRRCLMDPTEPAFHVERWKKWKAEHE